MNESIKKILVIEDEEALREIFEMVLSQEGLSVLTAENGKNAQQIILDDKIDLVVSDVRMPSGNGVEFCKFLQDNQPETPLIFVTGFADHGMDYMYGIGAMDVMSKPIDFERLIKTIDNAFLEESTLWTRGEKLSPPSSELNLNFLNINVAESKSQLRLGRGGMFIQMDHGFPKIGDIIKFEITCQEGDLLSLKGSGEVKWTRTKEEDGNPAGIGMAFKTIHPETIDALMPIIKMNGKKPYIPIS